MPIMRGSTLAPGVEAARSQRQTGVDFHLLRRHHGAVNLTETTGADRGRCQARTGQYDQSGLAGPEGGAARRRQHHPCHILRPGDMHVVTCIDRPARSTRGPHDTVPP